VTTDGQAIHGGMTAVLCREDAPLAAKTPNCKPLQRFAIDPGEHTSIDVLQGSQLSDPPTLLGYRVELLNIKGRSAGASTVAFAASGKAPADVRNLGVHDVPDGVRLEWLRDSVPVQIQRLPTAAPGKKSSDRSAQPAKVLLSAGEADAGGMVDATAVRGEEYRYSAVRVRTVTLAGQTLKLSSQVSTALTHTRHDTFPPPVPAGLAVIPGFGGSQSVDLSWEPVAATDLAGYLVYRKDGETWLRLTPQPIEATSYRDGNAAIGASYTYRITSIDETGNESLPSLEIENSNP
jgi:hypothetical protein